MIFGEHVFMITAKMENMELQMGVIGGIVYRLTMKQNIFITPKSKNPNFIKSSMEELKNVNNIHY